MKETKNMLNIKSVIRLILCLTFCLAFTAVAKAQSSTATLSGTVEDASGALVPGANVTVINVATGLQRQAVTNDSGSFTIPLLPPSSYTVSVEKQGFAPAEIKDVVLNVGEQRGLQIQLKIGGANETVTIEGGAPIIQTESAEVATVVDRQFVENIPLNGRSFNALISLTPGVVTTPSSFNEAGQFSVNGQRPDANYFTIDGASANASASSGASLGQNAGGSIPATSALGGTNNLVSVDALQEFRIQTSTFAPEFGRTPGAQVQIVTRSGANRFTGNVFDYFRNEAFDANDYFANRNGLPKPPIRQNDFGGVLGGPIIKNRTFFFFSYEGLRLQQPRVEISVVPTLATRMNAAPGVRPILNAFPLPNGRDLGNGLAEFSASFSQPSKLDATSIRIDHNLSDNLTLFGRYNHAPSETIPRGGGLSLNTLFPTQNETDTLTLGTTWAISTVNSNEFRFNYTKTRGKSFLMLDDFGGAVVPPDSLFFPSPFSSANALASVTLLNLTTLAIGSNVDNLQRQINVVDNHSIIFGDHSLKFGVDYRRLSPTFAPRGYSQQIFFATLAALNTGIASSASISANENVDLFFTNFSTYGQDSWKVNQRLTLTYGVRWDINPPPSGREGREPFAVTGIDNFNNLALAPRGTELYKTTYNNFAPRFGIAYQLRQKPGRETVLRGGIGIFYDLATASAGNIASLGSFPFGATRTLAVTDRAFPFSATAAAPPVISTTPPVTRITVIDPNLKLPRVYQWNLAVEQSLGTKRTVSATYVAALGRRLLQLQGFAAGLNSTFPGVTSIISNGAESDYHALQLQFKQRLSAGLQALVSYTWSHSIDTASTDIFATDIRQTDPNINRASSDFDIRHAFSAAITYNFPKPSLGAFGNALLRDWSVDTILSARSALPVDVLARTSVIVAGQRFTGRFRPNLVAGVPLYIDDPTVAGGRRINRAAFIVPPATQLQQGTLGRNALRGFSFYQVDLALRRQFNLTERFKLQFRAEAFNLFNHPNFANPVNNLANPQFGESTQMLGRGLASSGSAAGEGGFNPLYQVGGPRSMQFALKLLF